MTEREFGDRDRGRGRRVHDLDAARVGGLLVHVVEPDAGAADDLQVCAGVDDVGRDLGGAAHDDGVIGRDGLDQVGRRKTGPLVDFDSGIL